MHQTEAERIKNMKNMGVLIMVLFIAGCSTSEKAGYYKGYQLPPYTVSESEGDIELRSYQPQLVAEVMVEGTRDEAANKGFRILANYIFGDNIPKETLAMTTPVAQKPASEKIAMTSPVSQMAMGNKWAVQFGMPKEYTLDTVPKAKDERINFRMTGQNTVAAIRFSGRWSDARFDENKKKLDQFLKIRGLKAVSEPVFAYYDSPFTLPWNRRNEILVEVKK